LTRSGRGGTLLDHIVEASDRPGDLGRDRDMPGWLKW